MGCFQVSDSATSLLRDGSRAPQGGAVVATVGDAALRSSSREAARARRPSLPDPGEEVQH